MNAHAIHRRHGDEFGKSAWQPCDAVLAVKLALVRIARPAVFARGGPRRADAIQALIDDNAVARLQVTNLRAGVDDFAAEVFDQ